MNDWLKMNLNILIHLHTFPYIHTQKKRYKFVASNPREENKLDVFYWNKNLDTPSLENIPGSTPCPNVLKLNTVYPIVFHRSIWNYDITIVFMYIIKWNHSRLDSVSDCPQISFFFTQKHVNNPWFLTQFKFKK